MVTVLKMLADISQAAHVLGAGARVFSVIDLHYVVVTTRDISSRRNR